MLQSVDRIDGRPGADRLASLSRIALIGNALPRRCGLATYTSHVHQALRDRFPTLAIDHFAMNDPGRIYDYPDSVTDTIRQEEIDDYINAAARIEASGAQLVFVQHEFGIFGGPAGSYLLELLERLSVPIVITLHSVIDLPTKEQREVMDRLAQCSSKLIVMAEKGRSILKKTYGVPDRKIALIPHGVPDRPFTPPERSKGHFELGSKNVLLTFGLISPNKGIETMIEAMPAILAVHPKTQYVVAGSTHPHLVLHEGERYRIGLCDLAERLDVSAHVSWIDKFLDEKDLLDLIAAADIYVTPYLDLKQITSGALSYAVALGKPVISTPYYHAVEIISAKNGILADPGDASAFAAAVCALLADDGRRQDMAQCAYALGRSMIWSRNAEATMAEFVSCKRPPPEKRSPVRRAGRMSAPLQPCDVAMTQSVSRRRDRDLCVRAPSITL